MFGSMYCTGGLDCTQGKKQQLKKQHTSHATANTVTSNMKRVTIPGAHVGCCLCACRHSLMVLPGRCWTSWQDHPRSLSSRYLQLKSLCADQPMCSITCCCTIARSAALLFRGSTEDILANR